MSNTADRIQLSEAILDLIERKRQETGDESLGSNIERAVLESQIADLEREIFENPGAIEPMLVPLRRRRAQA
jgi:hypothetical protein